MDFDNCPDIKGGYISEFVRKKEIGMCDDNY